MRLTNEGFAIFNIGDLVRHYRKNYEAFGIVINVKPITTGYDVQVLWPEGRIANHHSNCLEAI